jgi:acetyl-CoA C-acetyltransferase
MHCTDWSVDQATALVLCSAERARRLGVPRDRWVFPMGGASSDEMTNLTARQHVGSAPGAGIVGRAALAACRSTLDDVGFLDLYSCFPVSVEIFAESMGIPADRPLTFTGSMPFAGGPFNNYVLHAIGQLAETLRREPGARGLVTSVSGVLTKQAASMWASEPPTDEYRFVDVSAEVDRRTHRTAVEDGYVGRGSIAGYTVLHDARGPARGVAIIDTITGTRTIAVADDRSTASSMERDEWCGREVHVDRASFTL